MKHRPFLFAAFAFALAAPAHGQSFAGEYADKNYQKGSAAFHMSIEGSGSNTKVWFSIGKNNGSGAAPEAEGAGKINGKGALEFKFADSCHNSGTGTITHSGEDIMLSLTTTRKVDAGCAAFYGSDIKLKRVK